MSRCLICGSEEGSAGCTTAWKHASEYRGFPTLPATTGERLAWGMEMEKKDAEIATLKARLALAERVMGAAWRVHAWGCPSSCDGEEHDWDALGDALAAWKEGEP